MEAARAQVGAEVDCLGQGGQVRVQGPRDAQGWGHRLLPFRSAGDLLTELQVGPASPPSNVHSAHDSL